MRCWSCDAKLSDDNPVTGRTCPHGCITPFPPAIGDTRVRETYGPSGPTSSYPVYKVEEWKSCSCPNCSSGGHWQGVYRFSSVAQSAESALDEAKVAARVLASQSGPAGEARCYHGADTIND